MTKSWRDYFPIHPAADGPLMEGEQFDSLVEDIRQQGLLHRIILWEDVTEDEATRKQWLLDGRNRLRALIAAGIEPSDEHFNVVGHCESTRDPYALVLSLNIHRRHLTPEQRQELLIKLIARAPEKSDRQIAKEIGVDHKAIGRARAKGEDVGRVPHVETHTDTKGRKQPAKRKTPTARSGSRRDIEATDLRGLIYKRLVEALAVIVHAHRPTDKLLQEVFEKFLAKATSRPARPEKRGWIVNPITRAWFNATSEQKREFVEKYE